MFTTAPRPTRSTRKCVRVKDENSTNPSRQNSNGGDLKRIEQEVEQESDPDNPFFYAKYENKPLERPRRQCVDAQDALD